LLQLTQIFHGIRQNVFVRLAALQCFQNRSRLKQVENFALTGLFPQGGF
jgi:hypothetical protein